MNIAYFISSHGFGHAARSCAVIKTLINKKHKIFIYTTTPEWFFANSLPQGGYELIKWQTDVGLVQKNPFEEDINQTINLIQQIFPPKDKDFQELLILLKNQKIDLVVSDISPLGILAAEGLNCDSILIENFTWDWIYQAYLSQNAEIQYWIDYFADIFRRVTHHFVTTPFCTIHPGNRLIAPISRKSKQSNVAIREKLGIQKNNKMILITMGGIPINFVSEMLSNLPGNIQVVFPVGNIKEEIKNDNIHLLPHNHVYFHPDLVCSADLVIAKVGYSTIAEAYHCGTPLLYIPREKFPESKKLEKFIKESMVGAPITVQELMNGSWFNKANQLMANGSQKQLNLVNGADQICDFVQKNYVNSDGLSPNQQ